MSEKYYKREGRRFVSIDLPQKPKTIVDYTGKYYQKDGSFVDERTLDSIGLCIISSHTYHVVAALEDCGISGKGLYNHNEAIIEVKKHFDGRGEIPNIEEMLVASTKFRKELDLKPFSNYRIFDVKDYISNISIYASLFYLSGRDEAADAYAIFGSRFEDCLSLLRPIMRVKQS